MKIRIIALAVSVLMLFTVGVSASFNDVGTNSEVGNAITQLSNLGIINGYGDGNFYPDETLTRAQFAKIAVHMLGEEREALMLQSNAVFSDVKSNHWANGYVNHIAEKGIINGYPDGTFGADETLNYAQALTILVRLLGYDGEDVGYKWPDGFVSLAESLGITKNMSFNKYEGVTRGNAAYMIYNTLLADKKDDSGIKLLSQTSVEDVVIYGDWEIDASLSNGHISTTMGTYKLADSSNITNSVYGSIGTLYLDGEQRATAFVPENETVRDVVIVSAVMNSSTGKAEITYTENANTRTESLGANAPLYYRGNSSTLEKGIAEIETGIEARLYYTENGVFERMYLKETSLSGPVTIINGYSQIYSAFGIDTSSSLSVIRNGQKAEITDIDVYDVVYYMRSNNTLYTYTDKISGTYEQAYPLKSSVTSVKVGGREYSLTTQNVINKMNESDGAFKLGDRVTLLLGRNGEVVDAVDLAEMGSLDLAVLTKYYSEISTDVENQGETIHYVNVVVADGTEITYEVNRDYSDYIGNVVKVEYKNEIAILTKVKHSSIYGSFDSSKPTLNGQWISNNCTILELVKHTPTEATVKKIELKDIPTTKLGADQVLHVEKSGSMRDITFMYLTDVTMSDADFGVIVDTEKNEDGGKFYTVMFDNSNVETMQTNVYGWGNGVAVHIKQTPEGTEYLTLKKIGEGTSIDGYNAGRARIDDETYVVSDYVRVYGGRSAEKFESMSIDEIVNNDNVEKVTLYSDRTLEQGGIVRVIIVKTKK